MQASSHEPSPCRTRASNVGKHPGLPDAPAKRHTPAEKRTDEAQQLELQAMKDATALLTLDNIAATEDAMKNSQAVKRLASQNLKGIHPTIKMSANLKEGVTSAVIPKGELDQTEILD